MVEFNGLKYTLLTTLFLVISLLGTASAEIFYVDDDTENSYSCEGSFYSIYPCSAAVDESWDGSPWYAEANGGISYVYENYIIPSEIAGAGWTSKVQTGPNPSKIEIWYWNYYSSSWDYLYSKVHSPGIHHFTINIPSDGLTISPLKIKTKVQNHIEVVDYFEGKVTWIYTISGIDSYLDGMPVKDGKVIDISTLTSGQHTSMINTIVDVKPDTLNKANQSDIDTGYIFIEMPGYDVSAIDVSTIKLSINNVTISAIFSTIEVGDHNSNGIPDLMVNFNMTDVIEIIDVGDVVVTINGMIIGEVFEGSDTIQVIDEPEIIPEVHGMALAVVSILGLIFVLRRKK